MTRVLKMTFLVESGKKKTWSIPDPKSTISKQEVEAVGQSVINNHFFLFNNSEATELKDYYIYETNTVDVN